MLVKLFVRVLLVLLPSVVLVASIASAAELTGQLQQGSMIIGKTQPNAKVYLNGQSVDTDESGIFVFGFGRDASPSHNLKEVFADGSEKVTELKIESRTYPIQKIEGVEQKYVQPPESTLARIRNDSALVKAARETKSTRLDFLSPFIVPAEGPITGVYGSQRYFNGVPKRPHFGLDIAGPVGTAIVAPADGVITLAEPDLYYSGGTLIIDHGFGISSSFLHLSELNVQVGDLVSQGQVVAKMGNSGRVTGPHLDWRLNWYQERLDPNLLLQRAANDDTRNAD